jgi:hypothetical protein
VKTLARFASLAAIAAALSLLGGAAVAQAAPPLGAYVKTNSYSYVTAPKLHPPIIKTDAKVYSKSLAHGYFFVANFKNLGEFKSDGVTPLPLDGTPGPVIYDNNLQPVWAAPVPKNVYTLNFQAQRYQGKPVLDWWEGNVTPTGVVLSGKWVIYSQQYKQIATLSGADGWTLSMHELVLNGDDAWVTAYKDVPASQFGGPADTTLIDTAVQEYDVKTGKMLFSWDAGEHIPLSQSQVQPVMGTWDAYHENSINLVGSGQFLVSMRNTWAGYLVNVKDGSIAWTLGGNASSFSIPSGAQFQWQHDMQLHGSEVSIFDDACCGILGPGKFAKPNGATRGLVLKLTGTSATQVAQYTHAGRVTGTQGNLQLLPGGGALVGWGQAPYFTEYSKTGKQLLDAVFPNPDISYRAYKLSWTGKPFYPPVGAARKTGSKVTVYASWDGATGVAKWRILGGPGAEHLATITTVARNTFETAVKLSGSDKVYGVTALDAKGRVLGRSKAFGVSKKGGGYGGGGVPYY